jgi:hypothetical protein
MLHSQARDGLIFGSRHDRAMAQTAAHQLFPRSVARMQRAAGKQLFSDVSV